MNNSAREIVLWIRSSIKSLALNPSYGSMQSACDEISHISGISVSLIQKIQDGRADNPTANTIDKLVGAVKQATRKAAA